MTVLYTHGKIIAHSGYIFLEFSYEMRFNTKYSLVSNTGLSVYNESVKVVVPELKGKL